MKIDGQAVIEKFFFDNIKTIIYATYNNDSAYFTMNSRKYPDDLFYVDGCTDNDLNNPPVLNPVTATLK